MKIYAPVKDVNGMYASVQFVNGVGETDNPHLIEWFKSHGYEIENDRQPSLETQLSHLLENDVVDKNDDQIAEVGKKAELDFDSMTPIQLREWARTNGYASQIKNIRNKEKLIEIIKG